MYRLGGTTLDATVFAVNGGMYRLVATEHDTTLGGIKFDELLAQHLAAEFQRFLCICELLIKIIYRITDRFVSYHHTDS